MEAVVGVKDCDTNKIAAGHVARTDSANLGNFVAQHAKFGSKLYTDESAAYYVLDPWYDHEFVNHSVAEYVQGQAHTNGFESFWSMLKRAHKGTFHKISPKHLDRYIQEFAARHNLREEDTSTSWRLSRPQ